MPSPWKPSSDSTTTLPPNPTSASPTIGKRRSPRDPATVLQSAPGRQALWLPNQRHRRGSDHRHHRTGRRLQRQRPERILHQAWTSYSQRSRPSPSMVEPTPPATLTGPTAKWRSTSRSPAQSPQGRISPSTSRPTPIAGLHRRPDDRLARHRKRAAIGHLHQLGQRGVELHRTNPHHLRRSLPIGGRARHHHHRGLWRQRLDRRRQGQSTSTSLPPARMCSAAAERG